MKILSILLFQNPFSFGMLDEMLPKPKRETFGSPQPYSYYPSYIFELPYSIKRQENVLDKSNSQCYSEYTVESFDSRLCELYRIDIKIINGVIFF